MAELCFKRDTEFRKQFFVPNSFAHPAKMDAQLLIWLVEHYTEPGQTILDPMFGSGTTMLACTLGRHVIGVELEQKFVDMAKQNWEKVQQRPQLGYAMGDCQILLGDARNLPQVLCDAVITSPPFADAEHNYNHGLKVLGPNFKGRKAWEAKGKADAIITSPPYAEAHNKDSVESWGGLGKDRPDLADYRWVKENNPANIANLPYGDIDVVISSPPYAEKERWQAYEGQKGFHSYDKDEARNRVKRDYQPPEHPSNIGNLPYGRIDAILTSPPYEGSISDGREKILSIDGTKSSDWHPGEYSQVNLTHHYGGEGNIGNLKAGSYLQAMLTVYQNCYAVLRDGGLMVLVVKNFIRNKTVVRLDLDTIKLCEQAGFSLVDQYKRKLPGQSFWRTIYKRKYPDVETIDFEDVLVFRKQTG